MVDNSLAVMPNLQTDATRLIGILVLAAQQMPARLFDIAA